MKIGLIRVITLLDQTEVEKHGRLIERFFPKLQVLSKCIADQPEGVHDEETEKLAEGKVFALAKEMEKEVQAIIVSCVADPAVKELKEELEIPVIGAGESLASVAQALGNFIGVITMTDEVPQPLRENLTNFVWKKVEGTRTTLDLAGREGEILDAANYLKERGCDAIALSCTGFSTIGIAPKIYKKLGIVTVDPVTAAGSVVYNLAAIEERRYGGC